MITKEQAFNTVLNRGKLSIQDEKDPVIQKVSNLIVDQINRGWLCCNLKKECTPTEILNITRYLKKLGYAVDDGIIYWLYRC